MRNKQVAKEQNEKNDEVHATEMLIVSSEINIGVWHKNKQEVVDDQRPIKQQPTLSYSAVHCVICLDILLDNEALKLQCGHKFHTVCIEEYNETNKQCPLCRKTIVMI
eukprot:UN13016